MGRRLKSHLDLLHPDHVVETRVQKSQDRQKATHDQHAKDREFKEGDTVFARNFSGGTSGPVWLEGTIVNRRGPVSFTVKLSDNRVVRRHIDHLRARSTSLLGNNPEAVASTEMEDTLPNPSMEVSDSSPSSVHPVIEPRRSGRVRRPPDRFS